MISSLDDTSDETRDALAVKGEVINKIMQPLTETALDERRKAIDYTEGDVVSWNGIIRRVTKIHRDSDNVPFEVELEGERNTAWEPTLLRRVRGVAEKVGTLGNRRAWPLLHFAPIRGPMPSTVTTHVKSLF